MVKRVDALLKMDVKELITAAIITATIRPRMPVLGFLKFVVVYYHNECSETHLCFRDSLTDWRQPKNELWVRHIGTPGSVITHP